MSRYSLETINILKIAMVFRESKLQIKIDIENV